MRKNSSIFLYLAKPDNRNEAKRNRDWHGLSSNILMVRQPEQEEKMFNYPTIDTVGTGQNIMRLRIQNGFSVKDIQDVFGFGTPQAIYKWQHGTTLPSIDNLLVLAALFHVHMDEILVINNDTEMKISA